MRTLLRVRHHGVGLVVLLASVVVAVAAREASAAAQVIRVPLVGSSTSGCVPPGTYVSGELHLTTRFTVNATGIHVGVEINSSGAKIFVPGLGEFISNESHEHETNVNFNGATETTINDSFRFVSKTVRENYRMDVKLHVTVNANGTVTANRLDVYIDCIVPCCGEE
jgi:hypothetical protein